MFILYDAAIIALLIALLPYFVFRVLSEKKRRVGLYQRLGFIPRRAIRARTSKSVIWVHSVSVGEVLAAAPLIEEIRREFPEYQLLLSTTTVTGHSVCLKRVAAPSDIVIYFPLDFSFAVRRVMTLFSPRAIALMETEIWPNLIRLANKRGVKLLLVNGRLSDKSFRRYQKVKRLVRPLLRSFSFIGMQTGQGKERMRRLGAPTEAVGVTGSMKYEAALSSAPSNAEVQRLRGELGIPHRRVIIAGSTHRGEEQLVAKAYLELKQKYPDLFLVIAPRHPERFVEVENWLRQNGIPHYRRSGAVPTKALPGVMLLDSLGELMKLYAAASVAFVGKSLTQKGGHNPLEPAACGKPVVFGPHMENFREVADVLLSEGGGVEVSSFRELVSALDRLLGDEAAAAETGRRARKSVEARTGGVAATVSRLRRILGQSSATARGRIQNRQAR